MYFLGGLGKGVDLSFSFLYGVPSYYGGSISGFQQFSTAQITSVQESNITSDIWLNKYANTDSKVWEFGYHTLMHELGHSLGLKGGAGCDTFRFDTDPLVNGCYAEYDRIRDFDVNDGTIELVRNVFSALDGVAGSTLDASNFKVIGSSYYYNTRTDADDHILYNKSTGALYYDADGGADGYSDAIAFVVLSSNLQLTASDFVLV